MAQVTSRISQFTTIGLVTRIWIAGVVGSLSFAFCSLIQAGAPSWEAPPAHQTNGVFWRVHWYERGLASANPAYDRRFRINSPDIVFHPTFGKRSEARENGLMLIRAEEDLFQVTAAEFYAEMWGGHPGTANKRFTVNGRTTYFLPRVGVEEGHCVYSYPAVALKLTDLVNGYDAFQFALDQGTTFWGHALIHAACLRVALTNGHPDVTALNLGNVSAEVVAEVLPPAGAVEGFNLRLANADAWAGQIASVDFHGWYYGYDENGNTLRTDWHGFSKDREPVAHLGTVAKAPFSLTWNTSMLPAQNGVAVRAIARFKNATNLVFLTAATGGLEIAGRRASKVVLFTPHDLPGPFWSRANRKKTCRLDLDLDPSRIDRAELHVVAWTGGPGNVKDYFTLNGRFFPVAEGSKHELIYSRLPVDAKLLNRGLNPIELLSDTEHHGIEICLPGPALMVRYRN